MSYDIYIKIITTLIGFIAGNRLAIGRDKRKEFNEITHSVRCKIRREILDAKKRGLDGIDQSIVDDIEILSHAVNTIKLFICKNAIREYEDQCKNEIDNSFKNIKFTEEQIKNNIRLLKKLLKLVIEK